MVEAMVTCWALVRTLEASNPGGHGKCSVDSFDTGILDHILQNSRR